MWQDFLTQQGISVNDNGINGLNNAWDNNALETGFITILNDIGLIQASGEEAAHFLHNQLSNDVETLKQSELRRAAYCSPKGRMLASLLLFNNNEQIVLQVSKSILAPIHKRLQMFVLRSKVKLADITSQYVLLGLGGEAAAASLQSWFPDLPKAENTSISNEFGQLLRVSDSKGLPRYEWLAPPETAVQAWTALSTALTPVNTAAWRLSEIQAGIPMIIAATQEQFVPQMVNFEIIGGVNFKKGCYPGQEIVARSQYLGKLKRRMALVSIATADVRAGMEVFSPCDAEQACGMVVNAEQYSASDSLALVEMKVADQESGDIHLGSATGVPLIFLDLPYEITDITQ
ncbi:YgfZ/GcvT domain-containing protein [Undibacterium sp. SXout7W]|uniref:CAF17-like 4Fe-4S cluster assembly/insertion protein YgfZ n=1 Tax=Undibacterium sp. SXout7W TaxID=3413049 RepID=UPI003BF271DA